MNLTSPTLAGGVECADWGVILGIAASAVALLSEALSLSSCKRNGVTQAAVAIARASLLADGPRQQQPAVG